MVRRTCSPTTCVTAHIVYTLMWWALHPDYRRSWRCASFGPWLLCPLILGHSFRAEEDDCRNKDLSVGWSLHHNHVASLRRRLLCLTCHGRWSPSYVHHPQALHLCLRLHFYHCRLPRSTVYGFCLPYYRHCWRCASFGPLPLDGSALGDGLCVLFVVVMCIWLCLVFIVK
jgi:hypothetical protein